MSTQKYSDVLYAMQGYQDTNRIFGTSGILIAKYFITFRPIGQSDHKNSSLEIFAFEKNETRE
jgi:hypothetical protein